MFKTIVSGLDVHAKTVTVAALNADTGEVDQSTMPTENPTVISWVKTHGEDTAVTYEAGPTGYGLRDLNDQGITCTVAAPTKLLCTPDDRVKTDQRHALGVAQMLSLGEITEVRIPLIEQEGLRDIAREAASRGRPHPCPAADQRDDPSPRPAVPEGHEVDAGPS